MLLTAARGRGGWWPTAAELAAVGRTQAEFEADLRARGWKPPVWFGRAQGAGGAVALLVTRAGVIDEEPVPPGPDAAAAWRQATAALRARHPDL
jgi:hypothetical protein